LVCGNTGPPGPLTVLMNPLTLINLSTRRSSTMAAKSSISSLPLPPHTHILTQNLIPDERTPSILAFRELLTVKPSHMRRARLISPQSHFSYVSPLPLPFPYRITAPDPSITQYDKTEWVEKWLSDREPVHPLEGRPDSPLSYPHNRDHPRELIGLAETAWKDCLPDLDIGDALATLGTPSLTHFLDDDPKNPHSASEEDVRARQELVDVLSGHCLLVRSGSKSISTEAKDQPCLAPWSLRYSGHQFGSWAGQLGDGRAISVRACNVISH
jgi:hypothetical protein